MKGDIITFEAEKRPDPQTGIEVTRLTDNTGETDHPYFTASQIASDSKHLIVYNNRTGTKQLYAINLTKGEMVQLTDDANGASSACLDQTHRIAYYFSGRTLKSVHLDDHTEESLMDIPEGFEAASLSCTHDGRHLAFTMMEVANMELCTFPFESEYQGGSKGFREKFFRWPSSVIMRFDTQNKAPYVVTGELHRMTHVIISPIDGNIVLFCHEGPWQLVQRMWIAKVATDEVTPLIETKRNLERAGHEFFRADGRVGAQYSSRYRPDMNYLHHADIYVNTDGSDERRYYYPYQRTSHVQAHPTENIGVGDGAHIRADQKDGRNYMSLIQYDDEKHQARVGLLCEHGTSWKKSSHPHPIFTPDGNRVVWGSDRDGHMNIYIADANLDKCIWSDQ